MTVLPRSYIAVFPVRAGVFRGLRLRSARVLSIPRESGGVSFNKTLKFAVPEYSRESGCFGGGEYRLLGL